MKKYAFLAVVAAFLVTSLGISTESYAGRGCSGKNGGSSEASSRGVHSPGVSRSARGRSADKNF